jgi:RNA polymerase sigma-70 factor (ECF subfamily)
MNAYINGDERAFRHVYNKVRPVVRRILRARLRRREAVVLDLEQSVFARAHRCRDRFRNPGVDDDENVVKWYASIARNAARSELRRSRRAAQRLETIRWDGHLRSTWRINEERETVDPLVEEERTRWVNSLVHSALHRLSAQQREIIVLHKMKGLPYEELSDKLEASPGTLRVRSHRGCRELRRHLEAMMNEARWAM